MTRLWKLVGTAAEPSMLDPLEAAFEDSALATTLLQDDAGCWRLELIMDSAPDAARWAGIGSIAVSVQDMPDEDWLAIVARGETQAGPFTIRPYDGSAPDARTILVDGNYAFGDGHHQTTRNCIEALAVLQADGLAAQRIADIGCGTGVLAIAAARLWPQAEIVASDLDPAAVTAAQNAQEWNEIALQIHKAAGFDGHTGHYDLILMNLLAGIVMELAGTAAGYLEKQGRVIVSGILEEQAGAVSKSFAPHGLCERARIAQDGWVTLILGRTHET